MTKICGRLWIIAVFNFLVASESSDVSFSGFDITSMEKQLSFSIPGFELTEVDKNGTSYIKPEITGAGSKAESGQPDLPTVSTFYATEPGKSYTVEVSIQDSETIPNVEVLPFESWEPELTGNITKGTVYDQDMTFPDQIATVSEPMVFRDVVMVQVSLTPFQYNPVTKELMIIHSADVELVESGAVDMPFIPQKRSREFEALYESLIINYSSMSRDEVDYQRPCILYVLPNNIGNLLGTVEQLMDWKKRVGYDVQYVSSSNVVNNRNNLKDYIEEAYET